MPTALLVVIAAALAAYASLVFDGRAPAAPVEARAGGTSVRYVAIGDSVTGTGSAAPNGWVKQYATAIGADNVTNLARNGWTGANILHALRHDPTWRDAVVEASLITVNSGMNEFFSGRDLYSKGVCGGADNEDCQRHMVARFKVWWDDIVAEVQALAPHARIIALNLYHPLEGFDQHFGWAGAINRYIAEMNEHIARTPGVVVADIHAAYNGDGGTDDPIAKGYILPDAIHGTDLGHTVLTEVLLGATGDALIVHR